MRRRASSRSPEAFRRELILIPDNERSFRELCQPWQDKDFQALDPAWMTLAGLSPDRPPIWRAYIERPRGHSKTSDMAIQLAWILEFSQRRVQGMAAAADRDQAGLIRNAIERLVELNPELCENLRWTQSQVSNVLTGSKLEILSSDIRSSWGLLPDFVICDEVCHWDHAELWHSLFSAAAKRPECLVAVLTNAGVGRGWQWELREAARESPDWYFSSLPGSLAPWISRKSLDEQRRLLPPAVYARLWENQWSESGGEFVTLAETESCRDLGLEKRERGAPGVRYFAALDYAEKHDYTVGTVIHREGERIVIDRMDVVVPESDRPVRVEWVDRWIREMNARFRGITFVVDEYQLLGLIQEYETRYSLSRFEFLGGKNNHALAVNLRKLIVNRELAWYPGCGQIETRAERDDLETELANLLLRQQIGGLCRIDHKRDGRNHDDRAFALGAACLYLARNEGTSEWLTVSWPYSDGLFTG